MLVILQVACAVSANYLESGFYTEVIIHKYTNNQTINIKYIFFLFHYIIRKRGENYEDNTNRKSIKRGRLCFKRQSPIIKNV